MAHFGELDKAMGFSDPETGKKIEKEALAAGKKFTLRIWAGAEHAFYNKSRPEVYNADVA